MTVYSQNGYVANDRSVLDAFFVGDRQFLFRRGAPGLLLWHAIDWFDRNIKDINPGQIDDWSFAERLIRGGTEVTNHASGTAGDVDATKWPLGVDPSKYLTADQIRRWREHLKLYEGCIRWGGDYTGRKDPMHLEVNRDEATCNRVWAKIMRLPAPKLVEYRFPIAGAIRAAFDKALPGLNGATWGFFLGQPKGPEVPTADKRGRWQEFDKGTIYWSPETGAHVVWGAILTHWRKVGNEGVTGYPVTDETSCPDTVGRFSRFAGDWMIYWSPATGAHAVHGAFLGTWAAAGYERSKLGYPTSDEYTEKLTGGGRIVQDFQRGQLVLDGVKVETVLR